MPAAAGACMGRGAAGAGLPSCTTSAHLVFEALTYVPLVYLVICFLVKAVKPDDPVMMGPDGTRTGDPNRSAGSQAAAITHAIVGILLLVTTAAGALGVSLALHVHFKFQSKLRLLLRA